MKKLFLILVVMVAFATTSSYAYTDSYSDQYRAWVYASGGGSTSLSVTLPSGYGYTNIWFIMNNSGYSSNVYGSSSGGNAYLSGPGYNAVNAPYYAGGYLYLSASSGGSGSAQISAYYSY